MGFEQTDTPALKFEKLEAALSQAVEATEKMFLCARLLSIPAPERAPLLRLTPQRQKDLTIAALTRHLLSLARQAAARLSFSRTHTGSIPVHSNLVNRVIPSDQDGSSPSSHRI